MLRFLFPRLTQAPQRGEALFAALTERAREDHWYREGGVPDTIDGRFRMLATLAALTVVRLEQCGAAGDSVSVALTERFIAVMESEHRELGIGDPKLGRTVRKLVSALARRVELWRGAVEDPAGWEVAVHESVFADELAPEAVEHVTKALRKFWSGLADLDVAIIAEGRLQ